MIETLAEAGDVRVKFAARLRVGAAVIAERQTATRP
jgi:hypothetical protein